MREKLLDYLVCPCCSGGLNLTRAVWAQDEIKEGLLRCEDCHGVYPIINYVPRFAPKAHYKLFSETGRNFGFSWDRFARIYSDTRDFLDWIKPVSSEFFQGKLVLDAGCGTGLHAIFAAQFGAREVIAFDLSPVIDVARENVRSWSQVHLVEADIFHLPLKPIFEYIYCLGVLQHLPDPELGFLNLVRLLKENGSISIWVYGYEGTAFVRYIVDPIRRLTSRMPLSLVYLASFAPTAIVFLLTRAMCMVKEKFDYKGKRSNLRNLPMGEYLAYMAQFNFTYIHNSVFDQLIAPITRYFRREEVESWYKKAGLGRIQITSRNEMSWRGFGQKLVAGN